MTTRTVEVMFTDRCPYVRLAIERVRVAAALRGSDVDLQLRLVRVSTLASAARRRFVGSPSIRVDGVDVDRNAARAAVGLHARTYLVDGRLTRVPPVEWIERALDAGEPAVARESSSRLRAACDDEPPPSRGSSAAFSSDLPGRGSARRSAIH